MICFVPFSSTPPSILTPFPLNHSLLRLHYYIEKTELHHHQYLSFVPPALDAGGGIMLLYASKYHDIKKHNGTSSNLTVNTFN